MTRSDGEVMENKKFDLEDRLVKFACMCLDVCDLLPNTKTGQNLEYQLSKSSTSSALVYEEAQTAESKAEAPKSSGGGRKEFYFMKENSNTKELHKPPLRGGLEGLIK